VSQFVLDASVALSWCFEDEADAAGDAVLRRLTTESASVPAIWPLEVTNVLLAAERRKRLTAAESARFLALVEALPIAVDAHTAARASREILVLARAHGLSSYDAAYLELAARSGLPLATRDRRLADAAASLGLELLLPLPEG
jgi:predicted nucleic acid-binding protein